MRLILLRHGETLWNIEKRLLGHYNSPLSKRGISQANAIKPLIQQLSPKTVISSDLGRAVQTAEIIGFQDPIKDKGLRELNMGEWSGRKSKS
ncbi:histidine phosphatase family protein [Glaesserella parasuis]|nr:histidine phosphatase family protein [Glaesserella parasuis]MDG6376859.1 histidine phosphatase family protein [Glaesserella parasuis]MDG6461647.1 histidine phosphatase family protein [Glaesserella parasuis]MDG6809626.1 histidine phosphatase family protein [Glaesserella parasuis]MDG6870993.1 histidine phosphatase family protein [Glaesserella parasuis]